MINNRDLSWLSFNRRVLQEAEDPDVPVLQRLRFLGIFSNNQDEFVKVRLANLIRMAHSRIRRIPEYSGKYNPPKLLAIINKTVAEYQEVFSNTYNNVLNEMEAHGIYIINETELSEEQATFCKEYFSAVVNPSLVPFILRKNVKMPFLTDDNIYHAIKMWGDKEVNNRYAIIQLPVNSTCPRFVQLPSANKGRSDIIFLDDIIRFCLDEVFFMFSYDRISAYTFKITRDSLFTLDDDFSKSLLEKVEDGLENRLHGQPIRMVYDREMPSDLLDIITGKLKLKSHDSAEASGRYHLKRDLMKFPHIRPDLEYDKPKPLEHPDIKPFSSIFKVILAKDILLNYPYHTFNHFIDFLREAAIDPKVESIYITLYRTAERSKVINALVNAAKNGKQVTVILELLARFDEEQNVENAEILQKAGVKVINGVAGLKVHCKLVLIHRRKKGGTEGYVYISTGNLNESTATLYTDFGFFTSNRSIVKDTQEVFNFLLNTHLHFTCKELVVSPYYMRSHFEKLIKNEIKNARKGHKSHIYAKLNSLTDEEIIQQLYKAAQAGVKIRLIVRSSCSLQPQVEGLSENIEVISIVDKYLEHSRIALFCNNNDEQVYLLSADWMTRNLDRRVEVAVPIHDKLIKSTIKAVFKLQWADNVKARDLTKFGENNYRRNEKEKCRSQEALYQFYKNISAQDSTS
jgi:polyphosphate kinase